MTYDMYLAPDSLVLRDSNGLVVTTSGPAQFSGRLVGVFTSRVLSLSITSESDASAWDVTVHCSE